MKTKRFISLLFSALIVSLVSYSQTWTPGTGLLYSNPTTTKIGIGITSPSELVHINGGTLKIGNSTSSADRAKNLLKFGDGSYVQIGEWEADDMLSFQANKYNFNKGNVGIGGDPGVMSLRVHRETDPIFCISSDMGRLQIAIASIWGGYAHAAAPGDAVISKHGERHNIIFRMPNSNNNGTSYIGFNDDHNKTWAAFWNDAVLRVDGQIISKSITVQTDIWSDFVFEPEYKLMPLNEVDAFIKTNKHLPDVAPAAEIINGGIDLAEMNAKLMQKIEELTLYIIAQDKRIEALEKQK